MENEKIGNYKIAGKISESPVSAIYKAVHMKTGNVRALRIYKFTVPPEKSDVKRILRIEATVLSELYNPQIVRTYESGFHDNRFYTVTDFVDGEILASRLMRDSRFSSETVLKIAVNLSQALAYANEIGVVHSDLTPENIFIREGFEDAVITGFRKRILLELPEVKKVLNHNIMAKSAWDAYAAPESLLLSEYTARSDIYQMGIILYECVAGFGSAVKATKPPLDVSKTDLPPRFAELVMRCVNHDQQGRPMSAEQLAEEFRAQLDEFKKKKEAGMTISETESGEQPEETASGITFPGDETSSSTAKKSALDANYDTERVKNKLSSDRKRVTEIWEPSAPKEEPAAKETELPPVDRIPPSSAKKLSQEPPPQPVYYQDTTTYSVSGDSARQFAPPSDSARAISESARRRAAVPPPAPPRERNVKGVLQKTAIALAILVALFGIYKLVSKNSEDESLDVVEQKTETVQQGDDAIEKVKAEENARIQAEIEAKRQAEDEAKRLSEEENNAKTAEEARLKAEAEAKAKAEEDARIQAEEDTRKKTEAARLKAEEIGRKKAEAARLKAEQESRRKAEAAKQAEERRKQLEDKRQLEEKKAAEPKSEAAPAAPAGMAGIGYSKAWIGSGSNRHMVELSPYVIDKDEVTVYQYKKCVDANRCTAPQNSKTGCNWGEEGKEINPMNCLTWLDANTYCMWQGKRLPTEAEWERAAKGLTENLYPWGNKEPDCSLAVVASPDGRGGCGRDGTWPVGSQIQDRSPYGVMDMAGNVSEFINDWYNNTYDTAAVKDPMGPSFGTFKVVRGGSWQSKASAANITSRNLNPLNSWSTTIGFRCARSAK
ncbi:MAG: SUMF1/EgtB/PvdO family nonheme iron enzyme [Elusimicrobiaceae bacterium]